MLSLDSRIPPNFEEYEENIKADCRIFYDIDKMLKRHKETEAKYRTLYEITGDYMLFASAGMYSKPDKSDQVKNFLLNVEKVPEFKLSVYNKYSKSHNISLNKEEVLKPLYEEGLAKEFLELYMEYKTLKTSVERMAQTLSRMKKESDVPSDKNIHSLSYKISRRDTGRYYTEEENVQTIAKNYLDGMIAPKGFFLYWTDFDQIDLRVAWETLLNEGGEYSTIFGETKDRYEAMSRIIAKKLGTEFNLDKFRVERDKYKVGTLSRAYGLNLSSLTQRTGDKEFSKTLDAYFRENKRYNRFVQSIQKAVSQKSEITMKDYFGVQRDIIINKYDKSLMNKCLNTPIQSTSNSVVIHYVNSVIRKFRELGFGVDKFRVYLIRHDEAIFMISEECRSYLSVLKDFSTVAVDDWSLLTMHGEVGYNYSIPDEDLCAELNKPFEETERSVFEGKNYSPINEDKNLRVYAEGSNGLLVAEDSPNEKYKFKITGDPVFGVKRFIEKTAVVQGWKNVKVSVEIKEGLWFDVEDNGNSFKYLDRSSDNSLYSVFRKEFSL